MGSLATTPRPTTETPSSTLLNRELSWLDLNKRVLELAADPAEPLLERVKFCAIFSSNLDEFFMVRVAGLLDQVIARVNVRSPDGRTPQQALAEVRERVARADDRAVEALARRARAGARRRGDRRSAPSTTRPTRSAASSRRASPARSTPC